MEGWIKIHRKVIDSCIYTKPHYFRVFFHLLISAHHGEQPIIKSGIVIKRGQYLRSYRKLQEDLIFEENQKLRLIPIGSLKRIIDYLRAEGMLSIDETDLGTLFSIVKYELYQSCETDLGTTCEQPVNNNKNEKNEKKEEVEEEKKVYGDYDNIFLSKPEYSQLLAFTASKEMVNELISNLSENIERGKVKDTAHLAYLKSGQGHYAELMAYWKYRRTHPEKKKENDQSWSMIG